MLSVGEENNMGGTRRKQIKEYCNRNKRHAKDSKKAGTSLPTNRPKLFGRCKTLSKMFRYKYKDDNIRITEEIYYSYYNDILLFDTILHLGNSYVRTRYLMGD